MSFWAEPNEIHEAERQESRAALRDLSEADRMASCQHDGGFAHSGTCVFCGQDSEGDDIR